MFRLLSPGIPPHDNDIFSRVADAGAVARRVDEHHASQDSTARTLRVHVQDCTTSEFIDFFPNTINCFDLWMCPTTTASD